jgi:hypothetical protein
MEPYVPHSPMPLWRGQRELYPFTLPYLFIYLFIYLMVCLTALLEIQSIAFSVEQLDY